MQVLVNSSQYYLAEFPAGFELVDKFSSRAGFFAGALGARLGRRVAHLLAADADEDSLDALLGGYAALLNTPVALH